VLACAASPVSFCQAGQWQFGDFRAYGDRASQEALTYTGKLETVSEGSVWGGGGCSCTLQDLTLAPVGSTVVEASVQACAVSCLEPFMSPRKKQPSGRGG
jgi:hypothetical protein